MKYQKITQKFKKIHYKIIQRQLQMRMTKKKKYLKKYLKYKDLMLIQNQYRRSVLPYLTLPYLTGSRELPGPC